MRNLRRFLMVLITCLMLTACTFISYPNGDYIKITYQEMKEGIESNNVIEIKEQSEIKDIVSILKDSDWKENQSEWSEPSDGVITLISEDESENEIIYVWFDTTSGNIALSAEGNGVGDLSKEKGTELKNKVTKN